MFSNSEVAEIRKLATTCTQAQIAARFGVTREAINQIINGRRYRKWAWPKFFAELAESVTQQTANKCKTREERIEKFCERSAPCEPLFDQSDYPTGPAGTRAGIFECDLFSKRRAGVDVEEPK